MRRMSGGRLAIAICAAAALPAGAAFVWDFYRSLHAVPLTNTQQVDWDIAEGSSFNRVIAGMERAGRTLESVWRERAPGLHLASPYEALILASIVEKETARDDERRRIAGVFLSRLEKGMLLQADPTVIYGMGLQFGGDIRKKDLKADTPYNTYRRKGLPPTPIAMPGLASLQAVLHPEKTGALYFVSRGDGSHHFSKTYGEHRKAVARYQLK